MKETSQLGKKRKRMTLALGTFLLVVLGSVYASEEQILFPSAITVTANAGETFGEVTVEIKANAEREPPKITSIRLNINGEWKSVPERAFSDLENVLIQGTEIRTEKGYDENPWLYIYFELPYRTESGDYLSKRVHIAYHNDKFESRSIETPISENEYKSDRLEL